MHRIWRSINQDRDEDGENQAKDMMISYCGVKNISLVFTVLTLMMLFGGNRQAVDFVNNAETFRAEW